MTEGIEDQSAGPTPPPGSTSPTNCTVDTGQFPKEKPEETEEAAGESGEKEEEEEKEEERAEGTAGDGDGGDDDGGSLGAAAMVALPGACCVCVQMEQVNNCLHSEKICILPILACLLSLALCTAGLKWVFVDKIFEYEPPTHLDPKRIGQDPIIMVSAEPTFGPMSPRSTASSSSTASLTTSSSSSASSTAAGGATQGHPDVFVEDGRSTRRPYAPQPPRATQSDPSVTLKYNDRYPKLTPPPQTTQESNNIVIPTFCKYPTLIQVKATWISGPSILAPFHSSTVSFVPFCLTLALTLQHPHNKLISFFLLPKMKIKYIQVILLIRAICFSTRLGSYFSRPSCVSRHVVACSGSWRPMTKPLKYCYTDRCARHGRSTHADITLASRVTTPTITSFSLTIDDPLDYNRRDVGTVNGRPRGTTAIVLVHI